MEKGFKIDVLDKGHVIYVDHMGSDQRVVEAARTSYKSPSKGEVQDKALLHYLYKNRHTSPFEQCNITFVIKMPIFVMRQFVRHRMFRLNEMSARYTEMWDDFYVPKEFRKQDTKNKQGSISDDAFMSKSHQEALIAQVDAFYKQAYLLYQEMIKAGVAKEMARIILPVANYTEIQVNCDLHNLMHFFRLRLDTHAQWEMRETAKAMYEITKELYPWTIEAFDRYKVQTVDTLESVPVH